MIKLMMALVYLSGDVEHVELKGSQYKNIQQCWDHVRQLSFTSNTAREVWSVKHKDYMYIMGGGFYCEVSSAENP